MNIKLAIKKLNGRTRFIKKCPNPGRKRPRYEFNPEILEAIISDIRPTENWLTNVETGTIPSVESIIDHAQFKEIYPDLKLKWPSSSRPKYFDDKFWKKAMKCLTCK